MGNSCSKGSVYTDDEETSPYHHQQQQQQQQQTRKLAKPRVGNPNIKKDKAPGNLPTPPPPSDDGHESTSEATLVDREAIRQHIISTVFDLEGGARPEPDNRTPERLQMGPDVQGRRFSLRSATFRTEFSTSSSVRKSSRRGSMASCPLAPATSEEVCPDGHYGQLQNASSNTIFFRRRSLVSAAPPATRTRKDNLAVPSSHLSKKPSIQLDALDLVDMNTIRAQTPSGYSVLGGFKRGSLQIVNGEASPASSVGDLRLKRRNTTPTPFKVTHSPLVVDPNCAWMEQNEGFNESLSPRESTDAFMGSTFIQVNNFTRSRANSSFSFETAPETGEEPIILIEDFPSTLLQPPVRRYSTKSETITTPRHSQQSLTTNFIEARDDVDQALPYTHHSSFKMSNHTERRPSIKGGMDSGYCSTGSMTSKASWSRRNSRTSLRSDQSGDKPLHDSIQSPTVRRYRQNSMQSALAIEAEPDTPSRFFFRRTSAHTIPRTFSFTEQLDLKSAEPESLQSDADCAPMSYRSSGIRYIDSTIGQDHPHAKPITPGPIPLRIYDNSQILAINNRVDSLQMLHANGYSTQRKSYRCASTEEPYHSGFSGTCGMTSY